jgi:nitronate monooxygenase
MVLDQLGVPVVLAPLAGGPSTPELAAAVSQAGGLGFLGGGYLSADELRRTIARTRELTPKPIGVNLFVPSPAATEPACYAAFSARFRDWAREEGVPVGDARGSDDDWTAKLEDLRSQPPDVVSFTFGCPAAEVLAGLRSAGAEVWVSVTSPQEAIAAERAGAQALVVQGAEAGGHHASFEDRPGDPVYALLPLLSLVREVVALMLAPEAGTSPAHRDALRSDAPTVLTRAFTGRLARGIRNRVIDQHGAAAPVAYPELHYLTAPMRRAARERGDAGLINLWAGEAHALARAAPAAEIVSWLASPGAPPLRKPA